MSNFRASDNHVSHSSNTNFTHTTNVFGSAQTDDLQAWMRDQAAQSGALCVPGVFAPRLTESIAQSSGFRACVLQQSACMLLKGSMGAGKTTAICKLIQELRKEEHVIVVFILFDSSRALQQDPSRVLMHFVRQIVDLDDHDQRVLVSRLQQRSSCDRPSADEVVDTFIALTARRTQNSKEALCILLDGLDQFNNRDDLDTLLRHVANIQRRTRCGVIVTSRFEEICFHSIFKTHSDIPISATYEDAEHIVRSYSPSHHVGDLIVRDASLVNTISRAVMDGSRALFELVMSNTAYVMRTNTNREFYKALDTVSSMTRHPVEIHKTLCGPAFDKRIESLISRCDDSDNRDTRNQDLKDIVTFVRDACRPLLAVELLYMLALRRDATNFSQMDLKNAKVIPDITQGLVSIDRNGVVQFFHPALRAHLRHDPRWLLQFPDANFVLARLCLNYLPRHLPDGFDESEIDSFSLTSNSPFLLYSIQQWHVHYATAMKTGHHTNCKSLQASALQFLLSKNSFFWGVELMRLPAPVQEDLQHPDLYRIVWNEPREGLSKDRRVSAHRTEGTTGLQLAIMLKLDDLVTALTEKLGQNLVYQGFAKDAASTHARVPFDQSGEWRTCSPTNEISGNHGMAPTKPGGKDERSIRVAKAAVLPIDSKDLTWLESEYEEALSSATAAAFTSARALIRAGEIRANDSISPPYHTKDEQRKIRKASFDQSQHRAQDHSTQSSDWSDDSDLQESSRPQSEARFVAVKMLGAGGFGRVSMVRQKRIFFDTPVYFARKFTRLPPTSRGSRSVNVNKQMAINEAEILKRLQHHHIISSTLLIEEMDGLSLMMPTVADSDLHVFLESCIKNYFPGDRIAWLDEWFGCLISALKYVHANRIIHGDIKPHNILIEASRVYLADFGCARDFGDPKLSNEQWSMGTPMYQPPEPGPVKPAGDVFALGCVFSEMLTIRQGRTMDDYMAARMVKAFGIAYRKNLAGVQSWLNRLFVTKKGNSNVLLEMVLNMLEEDPHDRDDAKGLKARLNESLICGRCA